MGFIKNIESLAITPKRKIALELVEAALASIQPETVMAKNFVMNGSKLKVMAHEIDLSQFGRVVLLGIGKGSARICKLIEDKLGDNLDEGYVIDVDGVDFKRIEFTKGTHPLPSQANLDFTKKVIARLGKLGEKDLVFMVTCGGGSALFESPHSVDLKKLEEVNKALLHSGATISEMNVVRKHLSSVKGGGLAKILFPTKMFNLIFSDVPGNDLSVIASAPTVMDKTTITDVKNVIEKYDLQKAVEIVESDFAETPKEEKYFENIENVMMLSNLTALSAMGERAKELGKAVSVFSDHFEGDADTVGKQLVDAAGSEQVLLAGGETTVRVKGSGVGGRNMELVLGTLADIGNSVIVSFDSDGWDNCDAAGAIGDLETINKARAKNLSTSKFLSENNSLPFFESVGDAILTGRLPSNVSDLMIVVK